MMIDRFRKSLKNVLKNINLTNTYLRLRYGRRKLERLRSRSLPYVGDPRKLAEMNNAELMIHLREVLNDDFKRFFKKAIKISSPKERIDSING